VAALAVTLVLRMRERRPRASARTPSGIASI